MKSIADALARIQKTLDAPRRYKLDSTIARMDSTIARADAEWNESDHPRGPDGKFASGGIGSMAKAAVANYEKSLKGKKGSVANMMIHMLKFGGSTLQDIQNAAASKYGKDKAKDGYALWYYKDLLKKGETLNPLPVYAGKGQVGTPGFVSQQIAQEYLTNTPKPTAGGLIKEMLMQHIAAEDAFLQAKGLFGDKVKEDWVDYYHKELIKEKGKANVPSLLKTPPVAAPPSTAAAPPPPAASPPKPIPYALFSELSTLKSHWQNVLPENQAVLNEKQAELMDAINENKYTTEAEMTEAIKALTPIPAPIGMGQSSMNQFIEKVKDAYGVSIPNSPASSSLPAGASKKLQAETYEKAIKAGHHSLDSVSKFEDASGNKVKSRLVADTENIPYDGFAKITASYGNSTDAMTQAVDSSMQDYADKVRKSLSIDEQTVISDYQDGDYTPINEALLGIDPHPTKHTKSRLTLSKTL
jgi:hypothetical protein